MWAHYADEYSGAVIEFDSDHPFFTGQIEIEYCVNRPKIDIAYFLRKDKPIPLSTLFVKPKTWEYEEEVRIARSINDLKIKKTKAGQYPLFLAEIPLECIKSITLGERTTDKNSKNILNKIKETNIELNLAAISNWGYQFHHEPIKMNQPLSTLSPWISPRTAHLFKDDKSILGEMARWTVANHPLRIFTEKKL
jgi:hypothetical protein